MESGISESLTIDSSGEAQFFHYDRYQLVVHSRQAGRLDPGSRSVIFDKSPVLQQSLRVSSWGQLGITQGDLFSLTIENGDGAVETTGGILQDAPPALQNYIRRLREFAGKLPVAELAPEYLQAQVVDGNRRTALGRRGQVFRKPQEFPELRSLLEQCARHAGEFVTVSRSQQRLLLDRGQAVWEYLQVDAVATQLTLYSGNNSQPRSKEKK